MNGMVQRKKIIRFDSRLSGNSSFLSCRCDYHGRYRFFFENCRICVECRGTLLTWRKKCSQESLSDSLSGNYDKQNICILVLILTHTLGKGEKTAGKWLQRKKEW